MGESETQTMDGINSAKKTEHCSYFRPSLQFGDARIEKKLGEHCELFEVRERKINAFKIALCPPGKETSDRVSWVAKQTGMREVEFGNSRVRLRGAVNSEAGPIHGVLHVERLVREAVVSTVEISFDGLDAASLGWIVDRVLNAKLKLYEPESESRWKRRCVQLWSDPNVMTYGEAVIRWALFPDGF